MDETFHRYYWQLADGCGLAEGAAELLAARQAAGGTQSLCSLAPHERLLPIIDAHGIAGYFQRVDGRTGHVGWREVRSAGPSSGRPERPRRPPRRGHRGRARRRGGGRPRGRVRGAVRRGFAQPSESGISRGAGGGQPGGGGRARGAHSPLTCGASRVHGHTGRTTAVYLYEDGEDRHPDRSDSLAGVITVDPYTDGRTAHMGTVNPFSGIASSQSGIPASRGVVPTPDVTQRRATGVRGHADQAGRSQGRAAGRGSPGSVRTALRGDSTRPGPRRRGADRVSPALLPAHAPPRT